MQRSSYSTIAPLCIGSFCDLSRIRIDLDSRGEVGIGLTVSAECSGWSDSWTATSRHFAVGGTFCITSTQKFTYSDEVNLPAV